MLVVLSAVLACAHAMSDGHCLTDVRMNLGCVCTQEVAIPMAAASLAMAGVAMAAGFMKEDKPAAAAKK